MTPFDRARSLLVVRARIKSGEDRANQIRRALDTMNLPGQAAPAWRELGPESDDEGTCAAIDELDAGLADVVRYGSGGEDGERQTGWVAHRYRLSDGAMAALGLPEWWFVEREGTRSLQMPTWAAVDVIFFPLEVAFLVVHLNWSAGKGKAESVEAICRGLDEARHLTVANGGRIRVDTVSVGEKAPPAAVEKAHEGASARAAALRSLGLAMTAANEFDLSAVARLLLGEFDGGPARPGEIEFLSHYAYCVSAVRLAERVTPDYRRQLAFCLRRGYDPARYPVGPEDKPDEVFWPRAGRSIGLAREGVASLGDPEDWIEFPNRFATVYSRLALHALAERASLSTLSRRISAIAHTNWQGANADTKLREGAREATRYTLTMVVEDPGGLTDHAHFFRSARDVLGTPEQLAEVREEIRELLSTVGADAERQRATEAHARDERERIFQRNVSHVAAFASAIGVVAGLLGMNASEYFSEDAFTDARLAFPFVALALGGLLGLVVKRMLGRSSGDAS